jgi:hypothetical protein
MVSPPAAVVGAKENNPEKQKNQPRIKKQIHLLHRLIARLPHLLISMIAHLHNRIIQQLMKYEHQLEH